MSSPYRIYEIQDNDDLSAVFEMWNESLGITLSTAQDKYNRYYKNNPYSKGTILVLKHIDSNHPVGAVGLVYRDFIIEGKKYTGKSLLDFVVSKEHRTLGPALMLLDQAVKWKDGVADFLYSFPNSKSEIIIKRTSCKRIGHLSRYAKVLNYAPYLRKKLGKISALVPLVSLPPNFMAHLKRFINRLKNSRKYTSKFTSLKDFLDKERLPKISQFRLMGDRSVDFYSWQFDKKCLNSYQVFSIHNTNSSDNEVLSAFVFSTEGNSIEIIDILSDPGLIDQALSLFDYEVAKHFKKDSISTHLTSKGPLTDNFLKLGYSLRDADKSPIYINTFDNKSLWNSFENLQNSLWTYADMDV